MKGSVHFRKDRGVWFVLWYQKPPGAIHHCPPVSNSTRYSMISCDHARLDSVKRYAKVEVSRRRELMEGKVVSIQKISSDQGEN